MTANSRPHSHPDSHPDAAASTSTCHWRIHAVLECRVTQVMACTVTVYLGSHVVYTESFPDEARATARAKELRQWLLHHGGQPHLVPADASHRNAVRHE